MTLDFDRAAAIAAIDAALRNCDGEIYVPPNTDSKAMEAHLRAHICDPFAVSAEVMSPGFPFSAPGTRLVGLCLAHCQGCWLAYQPVEDRFLCFWGEDVGNLGAHGIYGNPLYCWSA